MASKGNEEIVCHCHQVTKQEIIDKVKEGCDTVEKIGEATGAGTGCGGCQGEIQEIIDQTKQT